MSMLERIFRSGEMETMRGSAAWSAISFSESVAANAETDVMFRWILPPRFVMPSRSRAPKPGAYVTITRWLALVPSWASRSAVSLPLAKAGRIAMAIAIAITTAWILVVCFMALTPQWALCPADQRARGGPRGEPEG